MKKLMIIAVLLVLSNVVFSQTHYYKAKYEKPFTFQVAPTYFNYGGYLVGYQIGVNFKEVFNLSYFHTRDYDFGERYMDDRFAGIHSSVMLPVSDKLQIGPSVRLATYNAEFQKVFVAAEARLALNDSWKLGFEYGVGEKKGYGLKFIWNMY
ncbi:hypothetical protein ACV07N_10270 [Roseivirga echinicomitans]